MLCVWGGGLRIHSYLKAVAKLTQQQFVQPLQSIAVVDGPLRG